MEGKDRRGWAGKGEDERVSSCRHVVVVKVDDVGRTFWLISFLNSDTCMSKSSVEFFKDLTSFSKSVRLLVRTVRQESSESRILARARALQYISILLKTQT